MPHLLGRFIASLLTCLIAVTPASGQYSPSGRYSVIDLGTLSSNTYSEGLSINVWGHIVGCSGEPGYSCDDSSFQFTDGFVWTRPGSITAMTPLPGGTLAYADAINDLDWIAGSSSGAFQAQLHATLWKSDGKILDLGTLDNSCYETCNSYASAVNDNGTVVGCSAVPTQDYPRAFLWTEHSGMIDLGDRTTCAYAVNLGGAAVGELNNYGNAPGATHAFLWTPRDGIRDLGVLKGAASSWSIAFGLNDFNGVVGQSAIPGGDFHYFHAFLWTMHGGMRDLGVLGSGDSSEAMAINDVGQIVGWSGANAFIWTRLDGMKNLNDFIDPKSGWTLNSANAITVLGQITGIGTINGETHAFLLSPLYQLN